jgi:hypothetical protein
VVTAPGATPLSAAAANMRIASALPAEPAAATGCTTTSAGSFGARFIDREILSLQFLPVHAGNGILL